MSSVTKRRSWHPGEGTGKMRAGAAISFYFEKKRTDITDIGDTDTIISPNNATIAQCLQVPWRYSHCTNLKIVVDTTAADFQGGRRRG